MSVEQRQIRPNRPAGVQRPGRSGAGGILRAEGATAHTVDVGVRTGVGGRIGCQRVQIRRTATEDPDHRARLAERDRTLPGRNDDQCVARDFKSLRCRLEGCRAVPFRNQDNVFICLFQSRKPCSCFCLGCRRRQSSGLVQPRCARPRRIVAEYGYRTGRILRPHNAKHSLNPVLVWRRCRWVTATSSVDRPQDTLVRPHFSFADCAPAACVDGQSADCWTSCTRPIRKAALSARRLRVGKRRFRFRQGGPQHACGY